MSTRTQLEHAADRFGKQIAARLNEGQSELPYVVLERLRASREQALAVRKRSATLAIHTAAQEADLRTIEVQSTGSAAWGSGGRHGMDWTPQWLRNALTALPIAAMVAGIAFITIEQDFSSTIEVAELDTELLIDTLPPDAYSDPGFIQFLQNSPPSAISN